MPTHALEVAVVARENARNLHSAMCSAAAAAGCLPEVLQAMHAAAAPMLAKADAKYQEVKTEAGV